MTVVEFLAEWAIRSAAVILSGALLMRVLRVKDPAIRLAASIAMLCGSLAMPILTAALPAMPLALIRVKLPRRPARQSETAWVIDQTAPAPGSVERAPHPAGGGGISHGYRWPRIALAIYVVVAGVLLLRLCAGLIMSGRLLRRSRVTGETTDGIEIRESEDVSGPLTLGLAQSAIVLPCDWRGWQAAKLEAVLAHERSHIRRRDPAVQVLSTVHRALLWHSPMSWYLHRRIVRAAEEASDDAAVAAVRDRASYAEMLLEFMQSGMPAVNWHGVAMARYGKAEDRIQRILDGTTASRGITRWTLAAVLALGSPLVLIAAAAHLERVLQPAEQHTAPAVETAAVIPATPAPRVPVRSKPARLTFETAEIQSSQPGSRPGPVRALPAGDGYSAKVATLKLLISLMYKVPERQITAGPSWLDSDKYDIEARADGPHSLKDLHVMFQNLLADRFQLRFHREIKDGPIFALTVDASGLKMKTNESPQEFTFPISYGRAGIVIGTRVSMEYLSWWLGQGLQKDARPVIDRTGLTKNYDFTLLFAPQLPPNFPVETLPPGMLDRPSIYDALREQLGLQLQAEEGPVEYLVIDHVERPDGKG
jgi:uncharacterized protein (TIGR03435 family)